SAQTIRSWEKLGLLTPSRTSGRQRLFDAGDLRRAQRIVALRRQHGWNPAAIRSALAEETTETGALSPRKVVGTRIREARHEQGLTLAELGGRIGVSAATLSAIERSEEPISPRMLSALSQALNLPMSTFSPPTSGPDPVMRRSARPRTEMAEGVRWEELSPLGHALEPALLIVPPGGSSGGAYTRPGEVFVLVLAGALRVALDDDPPVTLEEGDSLIVEPFTGFVWHNPGPAEVRAVYVEQRAVTPPRLQAG
ncbi:MAG TPA: helix-turn-helix domain-containing protein, partial [Pseudonocardia sp.]|nr:helix-turn-helix domain-containing protein [Pseudonocardia sp.]